MIDSKVFQMLFKKWIEYKLKFKEKNYVGIDGKTIKGNRNDEKNILAVYRLLAMNSEL